MSGFGKMSPKNDAMIRLNTCSSNLGYWANISSPIRWSIYVQRGRSLNEHIMANHRNGARAVSISAKKWTPKHHEMAKEAKSVLFKWEMDKRYFDDENERSNIQCCGTMSPDKARRIWAIINER